MLVTALKSFEHNGKITRGQTFDCSELIAHGLKRAKLVTFEDPKVNFTTAEALPPSALPPAPALPQATVSLSEDGETLKLKKKPGRKKKSS